MMFDLKIRHRVPLTFTPTGKSERIADRSIGGSHFLRGCDPPRRHAATGIHWIFRRRNATQEIPKDLLRLCPPAKTAKSLTNLGVWRVARISSFHHYICEVAPPINDLE
jgi:hypothetical protein